MDKFDIDDIVLIDSPNHRKHGQFGRIVYYGHFLGTWGVDINGDRHGFLAHELVKQA